MELEKQGLLAQIAACQARKAGDPKGACQAEADALFAALKQLWNALEHGGENYNRAQSRVNGAKQALATSCSQSANTSNLDWNEVVRANRRAAENNLMLHQEQLRKAATAMKEARMKYDNALADYNKKSDCKKYNQIDPYLHFY